MKADRLYKFNSLALPKFGNYKNKTKKKHVSSTVVVIIRTSKLYYTTSGAIAHCTWPSGAQYSLNFC